jgi:hypothetical protein
MRQLISDRANDGPRHAAHDVRLIAQPANLAHNSALLLPADAGLKDNYHNSFPDFTEGRHKKTAGGDLRRILVLMVGYPSCPHQSAALVK